MSHPPTDEMLAEANRLVDLGRLAEADKLFSEVLRTQSDNAEAWMMSGAIKAEMGATHEAKNCLEHALALAPDHAETHFMLAKILHAQGELRTAQQHYKAAIEADPDFAEAWTMLAGILCQSGAYREAETCCLRVLEKHPDSAETRAILINALFAQAVTHIQQGKPDVAGEYAQRVLEQEPGHADASYMLGILAARNEDWRQATALLGRAIAGKPDDARYHLSQGVVFWSQSLNKKALDSYEKALSLDPSLEEARWAFAMGQIPIVHGPDDVPAECRARFARELANLAEYYEKEKTNEGYRFVGDHQPFYLSYHEDDNRALFAQHGTLCAKLMQQWLAGQNLPIARRPSYSHCNIGIASAQIRNSSVWQAILKGWFIHLDRNHFRIHVFHLGPRHDEVSTWVQSHSDFYAQGEKDFREWAKIIRGQNPDILIYPDIGLDPITTKLASMRLANTQAVAWGVPETTGLPTMDYFLSAEDFEPPNAQNSYTEKLVLLPHLGCTYQRLQVKPAEPDLRSLGIDSQRPIFLCPGAPFKYAPEHDYVFAEIARRTEESQFVFFVNTNRPDFSEILRQRLISVFSKHGMDAGRHLIFIPWQPASVFFGLMKRTDVFLDTIGFSGFNTAIQAVEANIPIVTREGKFMRGRLASGILRRMNLPELVTHSNEEYVELAVMLSSDAGYREQIRRKMENQSQVLFDDLAPHVALQEFLEKASKRET